MPPAISTARPTGGGIHDYGTVFELSPRAGRRLDGDGAAQLRQRHGRDYPDAGLIFDAAGNLYGTTYVWRHSRLRDGVRADAQRGRRLDGDGAAQLRQRHGRAYPYAGLIFDAAGNLYGTTYYGGIHGAGTVFELSPTAGGGWTEKVLHSFGSGTDGQCPYAGLIFDAAGNLYGTTDGGGIHGGGTVFELTPTGGGGWTEKVLHSFGNGTDGDYP